MSDKEHQICPVERAGALDNRIRRWFQNPQKIVGPYIKPGMTVVDMGCGPGFFSIEMATMVNDSGRVIASDVQEGMLRRLSEKICGTELEKRIDIHLCNESSSDIPGTGTVDFVLAFYMIHEVSDQNSLFSTIHSLLKSGGRMLIVEPLFHVSNRSFEATVRKARNTGLSLLERPKIFFSKSALFVKN